MRGSLNIVGQVGGVAINASIIRDTVGNIAQDPDLPAGKAGELTTRTNNTDGVVTLSTGHGITTGTAVDLYWEGGSRRGATTTVATNAVTITGGAGGNLPAQATAVVMTPRIVIDLTFNGNKLKMLTANMTNRGNVDFRDATPTSRYAVDVPTGESLLYADQIGLTNPLAGYVVASIAVSNADPNYAGKLTLGVQYDSAE